jgi:hypothetical protein
MKKSVFLLLCWFPMLVCAQFPAPQNFQINVNYIYLGESGWCNNQLVQGPTYCYLFGWEMPDTVGTIATLTGYRVYKNGLPFFQTTEMATEMAGAWFASFYVTALYENPAGESDSSNVVVINSLPISTGEVVENTGIRIGYVPMQRLLIVEGASPTCELQVYNMLGQQLRYQKPVSKVQFLDELRTGVYWVLVRGNNRVVGGKLIWVGE